MALNEELVIVKGVEHPPLVMLTSTLKEGLLSVHVVSCHRWTELSKNKLISKQFSEQTNRGLVGCWNETNRGLLQDLVLWSHHLKALLFRNEG